VIYEFARNGNVVIVGRGGQVLLKDLPGVFNVRIMAPWDVRLERILPLEGGDEKKATRLLHRSDHDSAGFLRTFFDVNWESQDLYDLIINTAKLSVESGTNVIIKSISSPEIQEGGKEVEAKLADLALTQKVEAILMRILEMGFGNVTVKVKGGVVSLNGHVTSNTLKENSLQAIAQVEGVNRVEASQLHVWAAYYGP
jgi:osmotically-inducible protein OsmY